jgi:putative ABC transport system permease protein
MKLFHRLRGLLRKEELDQSLADELAFHLEKQVEQNLAAGMPPEEARHAALRTFGGVEQVKERCRDVRRVGYLENFAQDVRYGLRQFRRAPGFTLVAVLTLALGVGANTAIFSVVDAVLLRPLPYKDPSSLVWATERFPFNHGGSNVVSPDYIGWQDRNQVFEQIGAFGGTSGANLTGVDQPARVSVTSVTVGLFPMLGVQPIAGRMFLPAEGKQGRDHVALLNETLWRSQFGADPHILGKTIKLDDAAYTVVGITPANLRSPTADVWTPMALDSEVFSPQSPRWFILTVVGRLKRGVDIANAQADLQVVTKQMSREYPPQAAKFRENARVEVIPLHDLLVRDVRPLLLILPGAAGFVLLIACVNVANLVLSRGVVRSREMAVRSALGARRGRLVRQLLTECLLLAVSGGALGCLAGFWGTDFLRQLIPSRLPSDVHLDLRVLAFSAAIAVASVLAFGFIPALMASRTGASEALKEGSSGAGTLPATHRLRSLMSAAEIALSLIMLAGAGLMARSFLRLTEVELGFDPHGLLMATVARPDVANQDSQQFGSFFRDALERVQHLPGVKEAAVVEQYPLGPPSNGTLRLGVQGREVGRLPKVVLITAVSPDYFHVMRMRVLAGRTFDGGDAQGTPNVAIVTESLAQMVFAGRSTLGQRVSFGSDPAPWREVVGVVADARNDTLEEEPAPEIYVPYLQQPPFRMTFAVRTEAEPQSLTAAVRKAVAGIDKNQPLSEAATMDEIIGRSVAPRRFRMLLLGLFALLALVLAAVGTYGVIAYTCNQRTHEFGVRLALGAEQGDILKLVVRQGIMLALIGVGVGIGGAYALTRFMASLLYGVKPTDPLTFTAVSLVLMIVTVLASYLPARRAMKVDPMVALRHE